MVDRKISELDSVGSVASDDLIAVVDTSGSATRRVQLVDLLGSMNLITRTFETVSDLAADTQLDYTGDFPVTAGDLVVVRSGPYLYEVIADGSGVTGDVDTAGGVHVDVMDVLGEYHLEAWGTLTPALFNTAMQGAIAKVKPTTVDFRRTASFTICCHTDITTDRTLLAYDTVGIDNFNTTEIMGAHIDFSRMRIISDGTMSRTQFMMDLRARNCQIWLPGIDGQDDASGIIMDRSIEAIIHAPNGIVNFADNGVGLAFAEEAGADEIVAGDRCVIFAVGTTDYTTFGADANTLFGIFEATGAGSGTGRVFINRPAGTLSTNDPGRFAETDNSVLYGPILKEELPADDPATRLGVGMLVMTKDWSIHGMRGGWCETPVLFGPGAAEVSCYSWHPFNGQGLLATGAPPEDLTLFEVSAFCGDIYQFGGYFDNGLILDRSGGRLKVFNSHFLELAGAADLSQPRMRVFCNETTDGDRPYTVMSDCYGISVGFYDSEGNLSGTGPSGAFDFDPDLSAFNDATLWTRQEDPGENFSIRIGTRQLELYLRDANDPGTEGPVRQVYSNGRFIERYFSGGAQGQVIVDAEGGQWRGEFGDVVSYEASSGGRARFLANSVSGDAALTLANAGAPKADFIYDLDAGDLLVQTVDADPMNIRTDQKTAIWINGDDQHVGFHAVLDPDAPVHFSRLGGKGSIAALPAQTVALFEAGVGSAGSGAQVVIAGGNASPCALYFGDTGNAIIGGIEYDHATDVMALVAGGADALTITADGIATEGKIALQTGAELTISGGAITPTHAHHIIDTEADASTDTLTTISGAADGDLLTIRIATVARTVVVEDGTGNIRLGGRNVVHLENGRDLLTLRYDAALGEWIMVSCTLVSEQGAYSFTPTVTFASPGDLSVAYTTQAGQYVRLNDSLAFISIRLNFAPTFSSSTGVFLIDISDLPFDISVANAERTVLTVGSFNSVDVDDKNGLVARGNSSGALRIVYVNATDSVTPVEASEFTSGSSNNTIDICGHVFIA